MVATGVVVVLGIWVFMLLKSKLMLRLAKVSIAASTPASCAIFVAGWAPLSFGYSYLRCFKLGIYRTLDLAREYGVAGGLNS